MKKLMMILLALLLCAPALAETSEISTELPVKLLEHEEAERPLEYALTLARQAVDELPEQYMIRAELAETSSGTKCWFVTIFDTATFMDAWCITVDASTGAAAMRYTTDDGFFRDAYIAWTAQKGPHALWSMEDKQLYDALYAVMPAYGLPMPGDLSAEEALDKALAALGMDDAGNYEVGYGYLMGGEGVGGVWEISLVVDGQVDCQVNLDAVTGEIYYLGMYMVEADEANG